MSLFEVYADDTLIFNSQTPSPDVKILEPKLTLEVNSAGSFSFKLPPTNIAYNSVNRLTSMITVYRDGETLFEGRVITEKQDFLKNRNLTCEGALAFLNDTIQPRQRYGYVSLRSYLESLISVHNSKCTSSQTFSIGIVTVIDPNDDVIRYTNYESTLEAISALADSCGGYLSVRYDSGRRYIDYLSQPLNTNSQTIEFGKNMLDFSKSYDTTDFATVVVPFGARLEETDIVEEEEVVSEYVIEEEDVNDEDDPYYQLDDYLTVESVNSGSIYVYDYQTVANYGWIVTVVNWNNETSASSLLQKARIYLSEIQFEKLTLELSAVDLHYMSIDTESIYIFDKLHCISRPHGMDRYFPVTKLEIPLDKPENSKFTLGDNQDKLTLSGSIKAENKEIKKKIDEMPSTTSVLTEAKDNAYQMLQQVTNGYITTVIAGTEQNKHSEKLIISDVLDYTQGTHYWEWGINGLAHYVKVNGQFVPSSINVAITMDGKICADYITVGTLNADIIKTGKIKDARNYNYWDLDTGEFKIRAVAGSTIAEEPIASTTYANSAASSAVSTYDSNLNQQAVFNKLTNNGAIQGLYMSGGQLYINAAYIATGVLKSQNSNMTINLNTGVISAKELIINSTYLNLSQSGSMTMKNGSGSEIRINGTSLEGWYNNFSEDRIGYLSFFTTSRYRGGILISNELSDSFIKLDENGITAYHDNLTVGFDMASGDDFYLHADEIHLDPHDHLCIYDTNTVSDTVYAMYRLQGDNDWLSTEFVFQQGLLVQYSYG